ncbi:MAG: class I SAM-dependent methyltransferase [Chloroflexi bacterium]|nr:class I SAM-dependent methyltransferase [Chloroflexota bacterium]
MDYKTIYATQAEAYERLVAREDVAGNILATLGDLRPLTSSTIIEFGAGTGRLTCLLAPLVKSIQAFDESAAMLAVARRKLQANDRVNWGTAVADHRVIPSPNNSADMVIEGWAFAHFVGWFPQSWPQEVGLALAEMERLLRPGGTIILLETLGTGFTQPHAPERLRPFYAWLETENHFQSTWIRTDYQFADLAEAVALLNFFFGPEMAQQAQTQSNTRFPECTGIWWKTI